MLPDRRLPVDDQLTIFPLICSWCAAWRVLDMFWADDRVLWADEPDHLEGVFRAISARDDNSHKLWTDDYLAAFAQASGAVLATLDTKLKGRYPSVQIDQLAL